MKFSFRYHCLWILLRLTISFSAPLFHLHAADDDQKFWSFRPIRAAAAPVVQNHDWARSPVDAFILKTLESKELHPSSAADRRTLIRRATFDLTGVPPTPDEIDDFLVDASPDAFAKVIDRLLSSNRYGERWGRHWLDVVRYADARDLIQLPADSDFREAWRYRDWVVNSFNQDLPYDQFIMKQVAGDLMQPLDKTQIDTDALIATGMLAIADFVPGDVDKQQMIADYVNDQIDVVGRAILGLTIACARCHDHKFDPISTEDYYSLAGIFFSSRLIPSPVKGNTPLIRVPLLSAATLSDIEAGHARDKTRITELTQEVRHFGAREYRNSIEQQILVNTENHLLATWDYHQLSSDQDHSSVTELARTRKLEEAILIRWIDYCRAPIRHPSLESILTLSDRSIAEQKARELSLEFTKIAAARHLKLLQDPVLKTLSDSILLQFRADDRCVVANDSHQVTSWPNRGPDSDAATAVPEVQSPEIVTIECKGQRKSVLRFSGNDLLQVPRTVPAVGSLFVVFRPDPAGTTGQRMIGWEDASTGQHGLGIMTDGAASLHIIARRSGTNGDVVVPSPASPTNELQILCVIWGHDGIHVFRDGQVAGDNKNIDAVTSDPAITSLQIGGPGSGSSSRFQGDIAELRIYETQLDESARSHVEAELTRRWIDSSTISAELSPIEDLYQELMTGVGPYRMNPKERESVLTDESRQRLASLNEELETLKKKTPIEVPRAVVIQDGGPAETPHEGFHDAHVYLRGNPATPGSLVPRGVPKFLAGQTPPVIREGSGRKELAEWLIRHDNPLPARVMVNRIWQHHFGVGLVPTSANFGLMGDSPSHPELLDNLAFRFIASGWSMKAMHRLIMLSNVYQQQSTSNVAGMVADPENRLLWRAHRRKLEAEAFRDSLFTVAGRMDWTSGGPGFQDVANPRRSLYLMSVRTGAKTAEFAPLFDAPDCSGIVERRSESIVAPQALFLMNDPLVAELATALSERVLRESGRENDRDRIRKVHELTLGRLPNQNEIEIGEQLLDNPEKDKAWSAYCRLIVCLNEFMFLD